MGKEMTQIKFTIESDIVSAFKSRCDAEGVSMTSVVRQWMTGCKIEKSCKMRTDTRPYRRKVVHETVGLLEQVLKDEKIYCDAIPEVFKARGEKAAWALEELEFAIECLRNAF